MVKVFIGNRVIEMTNSQYKEFINAKPIDKDVLNECREISKMFKRSDKRDEDK